MGKVVIEMTHVTRRLRRGTQHHPRSRGWARVGIAFTRGPSTIRRSSSGVRREQVERSGAVILGRRMYDNSIEAWDHKGPYGDDLRLLRRHPPAVRAGRSDLHRGGRRDREAPREGPGDGGLEGRHGRVARTSTGASSRRGSSDELRIHVVNVLFGGGLRLFEELPHRIEAGTDLRDRGRGRRPPHISRTVKPTAGSKPRPGYAAVGGPNQVVRASARPV